MGCTDEHSPCKYTSYREPLLSSELARLSSPNSLGDTHVLSFQPSPNPDFANQDRYVVQDWPLSDGLWSFRAIFDGLFFVRPSNLLSFSPTPPPQPGHGGHATVDYATQVLPTRLKKHLESRSHSRPDYISQLLHDTIVDFDDSIKRDLLGILPGVEVIAQMTDNELHALVGSLQASKDSNMVLKRCMHGSTALIALFDPPKHNLWIASLGDGIVGVSPRFSQASLFTFYLPSPWQERSSRKVVCVSSQFIPQRSKQGRSLPNS